MRLWTLHPKYLDVRGLVALWREALLAQAVLEGHTRGYTCHPQLTRFRNSPSAIESIAAYLKAVHTEAARRGYCFDGTKILPSRSGVEPIAVTQGQLAYEWEHLKGKLQVRAPEWLAGLKHGSRLEAHPLFRVIPGPVAEWEVVKPDKSLPQKGQKTVPC
jgi:hypothetical protein